MGGVTAGPDQWQHFFSFFFLSVVSVLFNTIFPTELQNFENNQLVSRRPLSLKRCVVVFGVVVVVLDRGK